jgi:outer membrane protein TolC
VHIERAMQRLIHAVALAGGLLTAVVHVRAAAQNVVSLRQILVEVHSQSPSVAAATARVRAAQRAWDASGKPEDPMLSVMFDRVGSTDPILGPMLVYMLEQPLPIPGSLGLQERVAARAKERSEADVATVQRDLDAAAARAYVMLWRAQGELSVLEAQRRLVEELNAAALARMTAGSDTHHDVLQTEVEGLALRNQQTRMAAEKTGAIAMINALRNQLPSAEFSAAEPVPLFESVDSIAELEQEALRSRPELRSMSAMAAEERAMAELMRRESWPMLSVGAWYNQDLHMPDSVGFALRGTLPAFGVSRQSAKAAESEARANAVEFDRSAMGLMIRAELRSADANYRAANERVALLRDVALPRAEQALEQARSSYRVAMMPFASVIQDQRMLSELRMELIGAQAERFEAYVTLMRALGRDLSTAVSP